jgi:hypothetical protein
MMTISHVTCEVAVVDKRGIALAADSAVTLGNGKKIYHTAEKLFSLSPSIPVAIMTFGAADMMNVPWETVVKIYAQKLGSRFRRNTMNLEWLSPASSGWRPGLDRATPHRWPGSPAPSAASRRPARTAAKWPGPGRSGRAGSSPRRSWRRARSIGSA